MFDFIWKLCYLSLYFWIPLVIYIAYRYFYVSIAVRNYYKKYPNVYVSPTWIPLLGDAYSYFKNITNDRIFYDHFRREAPQVNKMDFKLEVVGLIHQIKMVSYEAQKGIEDITPAKVDKFGENISIGKIIGNSFGYMRSTPEAMGRRKMFLKHLSFNSCSKYLPLFQEVCALEFGKFKAGDEVEGLHAMNHLTFGFFTLVMFGKDMLNVSLKEMDYENEDGSIVKLPFRDALVEITHSNIEGFKHPVTALIPILNELDIVNPFRRNKRNLNRFRALLKEAMDEVKDQDSVIKQLLNEPTLDNDEMFEDLLGFMCAGTETSAHCLTVLLFQMKKQPHTVLKAQEELREKGFFDFKNLDKAYTYENINNLDYVTMMVKEALRIDTPVFETMTYACYEDITVAGVKFPKGTLFKKDIFSPHWDEKEYHTPEIYIPERFDPESKYFNKPGNEGKARRPYSYIPFSYGSRACPGQTFSMLELKVAAAWIMTHFEFSVPDEILNHDGIGWAVCTPYKLNMKITKIYDE